MNLCACGCGMSLQFRRKNARFWSDDCRSRARIPYRPFVGLDGEGETRTKGLGKNERGKVGDISGGNKGPLGNHVYNLLASGTGKHIGRKAGLSTEECLDFLLSLPRGQSGGTRPIYVWFAMDYDVNMILADIPLKGENSIETLRAENKVYWRGYRITYIRRKILRIARGRLRHSSVDVWGFFQSSFEKALDAWDIETPAIISEGKASRSGFRNWSLARIREYNQAELDALQILCEKLRDSVTPLDLPIQSWHGPAALAGAWLRKNRVKDWLPQSDPEPEFWNVSARGYFGGRIDVLGYGRIDPVYHYDIISAYPSAIAELPNLSNLQWEKRQGKVAPSGRLYVARIRWKIPAAYWAPFPWRAPNGSIRYPLEGEGWYWQPEIEMAISRFGAEHFEVIEYWQANGKIELPFYDLIHKTFEYRAELKRENNPSATAVKLVLNSLYGKFAQTVGKAAYYSPIWAGLITSQTRAKLMEVLNDDVVCVMTDSIWSRKPLDVPIGKALGDWEIQDETKLTLAEAGLYEAYSPDGSKNVWQRGFDKRNPVDIERLVSEWLDGDPTYKPSYSVNRFVGMGLASMSSYPWRQWIEISRSIEPVPLAGTTKRLPFLPGNSGERIDDFIRLSPRSRDTDDISAPYSKITLTPEVVLQRLEEECSEDD